MEMMFTPSDRALLDVLAVRSTEDPTVFHGDGNNYGRMGIYGGHFLGQGLAAGFGTVEEAKMAHSLHAYFLRRGDPDEIIEYRVQTLRNGRGSDTRAISAWQHDAEVFHMIASFKLPEGGEGHSPTPPDVRSATELVAEREARGDERLPLPPNQNGWAQVELTTPSFFEYFPDRPPTLPVWMRVPDSETFTERQRQVVLAFLCDGPLMFNSVVPYGAPMETHWATSIDHSAWFHRPVDLSSWMLFDQRSTAVVDGRGMNSGEIYNTDGELVMTVAQESVLREMPAQ